MGNQLPFLVPNPYLKNRKFPKIDLKCPDSTVLSSKYGVASKVFVNRKTFKLLIFYIFHQKSGGIGDTFLANCVKVPFDGRVFESWLVTLLWSYSVSITHIQKSWLCFWANVEYIHSIHKSPLGYNRQLFQDNLWIISVLIIQNFGISRIFITLFELKLDLRN